MTDPNSQPTRSVVLAYRLERNGTQFAPNSTVTLPINEARQLVRDGRARWVNNDQSTTDTTAGQPGEGGVSGG